MAEQFKSETEIVLGYGKYKQEKGLLNRLIRFDTFFIGLQYFSYSLCGMTYMGVGRNLAYRKSLFYSKNGFINHYPDFLIQTKSGKVILLETKGDHLDAEQKIKLGDLWKSKAGNNFRYFMVYERRSVDGAYNLEEFLAIIKNI